MLHYDWEICILFKQNSSVHDPKLIPNAATAGVQRTDFFFKTALSTSGYVQLYNWLYMYINQYKFSDEYETNPHRT